MERHSGVACPDLALRVLRARSRDTEEAPPSEEREAVMRCVVRRAAALPSECAARAARCLTGGSSPVDRGIDFRRHDIGWQVSAGRLSA